MLKTPSIGRLADPCAVRTKRLPVTVRPCSSVTAVLLLVTMAAGCVREAELEHGPDTESGGQPMLPLCAAGDLASEWPSQLVSGAGVRIGSPTPLVMVDATVIRWDWGTISLVATPSGLSSSELALLVDTTEGRRLCRIESPNAEGVVHFRTDSTAFGFGTLVQGYVVVDGGRNLNVVGFVHGERSAAVDTLLAIVGSVRVGRAP